ncbi:Phosphoserine phosphatase [Rubellimicrobium mesophilum DSM 19309]|uniref:Phosphoserine phosphatase n=1 Tax=Rubellimicrobium mesophilum DSM 19309 TaxID=442562 RepID=A0A017HJU7_9RHOB|nr:phosphoserine phosphatase SerB [Rubellimicrobium mesophilum]EYD74621.1 Phosphoserine phosphatase [Rubellimicrobium mesophilum DSM 19309]
MLAATLIAAPGGLPRALPEAIRARWSGGEVRWLAPGEAAELPLPEEPADLRDLWEELQAEGIDLLLQPAANRRKRMLLADMDSTMIQQECIDELAVVAGVGEHVAAITARAMNGEIGFEGALRERVALLKDLPEAVIEEVLRDRITYMPGGATLLATMKAHGAHAVLVSGGFLSFARPVAAHLGFDEARANTLLSADGRLTGEVQEPILGREAKVATLTEVSSRLGLAPQDVLAVGDGANDLGMLRLAGTGVALHAKPAVQAECRLRVNHGDLTALLYLQGYARDEFA